MIAVDQSAGGCVRIPDKSYNLKYPDGVNRTDEMLSPVAPTDKEIILECAPGYVQVIHLSSLIWCFLVKSCKFQQQKAGEVIILCLMKICVRLFGHFIYNHQAIGDNGNQRVKCDKSGSYDKYLINCVGNIFTGID